MSANRKQVIVPVMLNGGRVTLGFREALFAAAARAGTSVNEYVLRSAGRQLVENGFDLDGVFDPGDLHAVDKHPGRVSEQAA
ncbi:hypothetical protein [Devosia sp. RR2S18]|uniref:hypothetical protein n=1 Tax=Devosia rhizosphaerae TaxID=3049774 RepID=UPI002541A42C|nr:hypothetical protein [Devosia sp. RR2S18]WIJ26604.1 hypothetical protein QOV41_07590 [Devosia sp. RR2S18]